jgi:AcrR family transcriptional regulator
MNIVHDDEESKQMPKTLPNIREDILQTTREMILQDGYEKLNIRDIARNCGIATGTFYNYFRSKQEIISSLLASDWEKMYRFVQRHMKTDKPVLDQLEDVFNDLKHMMHNVHEIWAGGFPDDLESGTMNKLQEIKADLRKQFTDCIRLIIEGHTPKEKEAFASDLIARVFFSYAYEDEAGFESLRDVLEKLLV